MLGLPDPTFTVLSSLVTSGKNPSNRIAFEALRDLFTERLYVYPRPPYARSPWKRVRHLRQLLRTRPTGLRRQLRRGGYRYGSIEFPPFASWIDRIRRLCDGAPEVDAVLAQKAPSTGLVAIAVGLEDRRFDRVIASGFSFEITHHYAANPEIARRGTEASTHALTDVTILRQIAKRHDHLATTERVVHESTGLPLFEGELR